MASLLFDSAPTVHRFKWPHAFLSIKTRITVGAVAVVAIGILLTTSILVREAEHDTLSVQRDRELREAVRTATVLSRRVVALQQALAVTAPLLDESTLKDDERLAAFFESKPVLRGLFSNNFAATLDGQVVLIADNAGLRKPSLNISDRQYFKRTVAEQRAIVSDAIPGRISDEPVIILSYPLRNANGVYGVIGGALRLTSRDLLGDTVEATDDRGETLTVVTDSQGQILAHSTRSRIMQSLTAEPRMAAGYEAWILKGSPVEPSGLFLPQADQVLTVAGVAGPDWVVWRALPESDLFAPLRDARKQALTWAAATVAVSSMFVLALISWLLRPLLHLQRRALSLFDDKQEVHADWPTGGGEIGELARVLRHVGAERAQLEGFNAQVLAKLASVMAAAPLGILFTRAQRFELVSAEFCRMAGRTESQLLGQPAQIIFASNGDYAALGPLVGAAFAAGSSYMGEWQFLKADNTVFWGRLRGQSVQLGNPDAGTIWTLEDVSAQVAAHDELEWSATHDALTGLANRKLFERRAMELLAARPESLPAAVVMIDLDRFKPINDTAGHAAGDAMLKAVATAIASRVRGKDLVARLGGDEFALLLENCPPEPAMRIAGEVREAVTAIELRWESFQLRVGASLGVASLMPDTESLTAWFQAADAACYEVKTEGRGAVRMAQAPLLRLVGD